jgi:Protein of unknown function (DUF3830)
MRRVNVEIGGSKFSATVHAEKAPKTCEALASLLPIEAEVMHSRFAGEAIFFGMKAAPQLAYENHTSYLSRGEMLYYPGSIHGNGIMIAYGASVFNSKVGLLAGNHFASITDDLDQLAEVGMKLLREGAKPVRITQAE